MTQRRKDEPDPDATIVHRPGDAAADDPESTVLHGRDSGKDPDATVVGRSDDGSTSSDPDATMVGGTSDRDPDATVLGGPTDRDPDATVLGRPADRDPDATMLGGQAEGDTDATVLGDRGAAADDADATVLHGSAARSGPDPDATVMHSPDAPDSADPDATVMQRTTAPAPKDGPRHAPRAPDVPEEDPEATTALRIEPGQDVAAPDPDATVARQPSSARIPHPQPDAQAEPGSTPAGEPTSTDEPGPGAAIARSLAAAVARRTAGVPTASEDRPASRGAPEVDIGAASGLNDLVALANPVLAAVPQLRWTVRQDDPEKLRASLLERMRAFEFAAAERGVAAKDLEDARFAIAALVDEAVLSTPWGARSAWAAKGLLALEFGAHGDGERFFARLRDAMREAEKRVDLLELCAVCLALGYEGRARGTRGGRDELARLRAELNETIRTQRGGAADGALSPNWQGVETVRRSLPRTLALWVALSGCALAVGGAYFTFRAALSDASQPIFADLARLRAKPAVLEPVAPRSQEAPAARAPAPPPADPAKPVPTLASLLQEEVKGGRIEIREDGRRTLVTINAAEMFASGSATIEPDLVPLVGRLAQALEQVPGQIAVTGHTDSRPIRTARFPSNWELSRARAESVSALIAPALEQAGRLRTEGVADSEPVAPNDTEANRRRNRRVVVSLDRPG